MNVEEKERLIKKDIASIENRVRSAFNQGYEMGLKENKKQSGDAISRKHLLEEIAMLKKSPWFNENTYGSKVIRKEAVEIVEDVCIKREPSVTPQPRMGRWIQKEEADEAEPFIIWECSECSETQKRRTKHCPDCGCKMEVEDADSN